MINMQKMDAFKIMMAEAVEMNTVSAPMDRKVVSFEELRNSEVYL
jgi:hypothetical protein